MANEGINGALALNGLHLDSIALLFNKVKALDGLHFNIGDTVKIEPFKKLLVKARDYILTDGLPMALNWDDAGVELNSHEWHSAITSDESLIIGNTDNSNQLCNTFNS